ncbi:MAG: DUF3137 domain-containing protein [Eubacterium sp.]|nr:DUF3137 domain-containing protein [Eubacterium sp.]
MEDRINFYKLNSLRKKYNLMTGTAVLLIIVAVLSFFFVANNGKFWPLFIFPVVFSIYLFVNKKKVKNEFTSLYKKEVVEAVLNQHFTDVNYEWDEGFSSQFVSSMNIISSGNIYHSEDYLSASYKGVHFSQADVEIEEETTDSDGNTSRTTYFRGRIIVFDYPKRTDFVRTTSKKFRHVRHLRKGEYQSLELENVEFNKNFYTYAKEGVDAFYLFTPPMMEKLLEIVRTYGNVGLSCMEGRLYIAINTRRDAFDTKMMRNLKYDREMQELAEDVRLIENLIDIVYSVAGVSGNTIS